MNVSFADWIVLLAYMLILVGIALYHSRKMKAQDDYFLAGRSMSRWPIALSMYVALFSTNSFVGVIGWVNRPDGTIWIGLQNIGLMLVVPLVIMLYPTIFFRLRITTAYEYLERRFNYPVRGLAAVFFLAARIMWLSTMLYGAALVVSQMLGWSSGPNRFQGQAHAILLIGAAGTLCALAGGMHAVIWTDVAQFFVIFGGVLAMAVTAVAKSGGVDEVIALTLETGKAAPPPFFSLTDELTIVSGLCLGMIGYLSSAGADQVVLQTYLTARSDTEAKRSLLRNGIFLKPLSLIFPVLGLLLFAYYHQHPEHAALLRISDDALPVFVVQVMPAGLRGLIIAAIISAVLTSVESGLAALSACVQVDFVRRWSSRSWSDQAAVLMGRGLVVIWGVCIVAGAFAVAKLGQTSNIIQILNMVMYPFSGVLLGVFLLGLITRRANSGGVLWGAASGFCVTIAVPLSVKVIGLFQGFGLSVPQTVVETVAFLSRISTFYFGALGALSTFVAGCVFSLFYPSPPREKLIGLSHLAPAESARPAARR